MKLTIITINRNDADGLKKTMKSVLSQSCVAFDYVVVDGASTDESVDIIKSFVAPFDSRLQWISEPDKGIYNAMNKVSVSQLAIISRYLIPVIVLQAQMLQNECC